MAIASAFDMDVNELKNLNKQDNEQGLFLVKITSGHELLQLIGGTEGFEYGYDSVEDENVREIIKYFIINVGDIIDIYSMVDIGSRMDMELMLNEQIKELEQNKIWVFGMKLNKRMKDSLGEYVFVGYLT